MKYVVGSKYTGQESVHDAPEEELQRQGRLVSAVVWGRRKP